MNLDALSDLVLLLVCVALIWRTHRTRNAVRVALGLIGAAALLGVLRFSGVALVWGPHRFFSLLAACAAFPLLAAALRWPDAPLSCRATAAGRFVVVVGGIGVGCTVAGLALWSQVVPGVSALLILWTALWQRSALALTGALVLAASFAVAANPKPDALYLALFNGTQALHYLLASGLVLLVLAPLRQAVPAVEP